MCMCKNNEEGQCTIIYMATAVTNVTLSFKYLLSIETVKVCTAALQCWSPRVMFFIAVYS